MILKSVSILNQQCAAMLAAPIMDHGVIFTMFLCSVLAHFSQLQLTFEGGGWRSEGFLLAKYHAEPLLIGCTVCHGLIIKDGISPHGWQIW